MSDKINTINSITRLTRTSVGTEHRNGETGEPPPRKKRFYFNGNAWFFRTREKVTCGPFTSFADAEAALQLYLRRCGIIHFRSEQA